MDTAAWQGIESWESNGMTVMQFNLGIAVDKDTLIAHIEGVLTAVETLATTFGADTIVITGPTAILPDLTGWGYGDIAYVVPDQKTEELVWAAIQHKGWINRPDQSKEHVFA